MSWTDSLIGVVQSAPIKESDLTHPTVFRVKCAKQIHPSDVCFNRVTSYGCEPITLLAYTNTLPHEFYLSVLY